MHGGLPAVPYSDAGRCPAASAASSARRPGAAEAGARGILTFLTPLLERPGAGWTVVHSKSRTPLATRVETAFDSRSRNKGLLGRDALASGSALILAPCSSIHTFFMRFAIDVLFVDRQGVILRVVATLRPWRLAVSPRAFAVVEMPAGALATAEVRAGDTIELASR